MSNRSFAIKPIALASLLGLAGGAHAAYTTYDSTASFAAVTSGAVTDGFSDLTFGDSEPSLTRTLGAFSYTITDYVDAAHSATDTLYIAEVDSGNPSVSSDLPNQYLYIASISGKTVNAIGGNFFGSDFNQNFVASAGVYALHLAFVDGTGLHDVLYSNVTSTSSFFSIVSTSAITSLSFYATDASGNPSTAVFPTFDNLQFAAAVPEPETYALMLGGLGVVAWLGRRQKKQAA